MTMTGFFKEFEGSLDAYKKYLDTISDSIKEFDMKLQNAGINKMYGSKISNIKYLGWKDKRLIYINIQDEIEKPLIECKKEIRIKCVKFLKAFMQHIASELEKEMKD